MNIKLINYGYENKPFRAHYNDAGADVYCMNDYQLLPGETIKLPLGFGLELPDGYMGLIMPRSSLSSQGITCELPPIDSGYRGEIHAIVTNNSNQKFQFIKNSRIGQLVILPIILPELVPESEFDDRSTRGTGAFGSTN